MNMCVMIINLEQQIIIVEAAQITKEPMMKTQDVLHLNVVIMQLLELMENVKYAMLERFQITYLEEYVYYQKKIIQTPTMVN